MQTYFIYKLSQQKIFLRAIRKQNPVKGKIINNIWLPQQETCCKYEFVLYPPLN